MSSYSAPPPKPTFRSLLCSFGQSDGLPFADLLPEQLVRDACVRHNVAFASGPWDIFTPAVTLWAWLSQCLSGQKSCVAAVARVIVLRVSLGLPPCSAATGGYCHARDKLPLPLLRQLTLQAGCDMERQAPDTWRYKGRRVVLIDGTTVTLPDTAENQRRYPQPTTQKPGLGYPMMRLVVLLTFATAGLIGCATGPYAGKETGETALMRGLFGEVRPGDVIVADRFYCTYWMVAALLKCQADVCFRLHQRRKYDFNLGESLGKGDHVVRWVKPARPKWMSVAEYDQMPETLTVREVQVTVSNPGFRSRSLVVATTLRDVGQYSSADIADLYNSRWHVELDIRAIKQTLGMSRLVSQTPDRAEREVWTHLLAYNLVRAALAQAALAGGFKPRQLSFAAAMQTLEAFRVTLLLVEGPAGGQIRAALLVAIGSHKVGKRPGRNEPRKLKGRHRKFEQMSKPRKQEQAAMCQAKKDEA